MRETLERELKLAPGEGFTMPELGGDVLPTRIFVSTYHDTPDLRLARHGITFRHRIEDGAGLWQLKLPREGARLELERAGPPAVPPSELLALLPAFLRRSSLVPVARLRTRREVVRLPGAEIADDSVAVLDGQHVIRRFHELEVELLDGGDEETMRRIETELRRAGADGGPLRAKLYRALDLEIPSERRVPKRATPGQALAIRLQNQVAQLLVHDPGTRLGGDPEDLHQLRVATRRLRAFLRAARGLLTRERSEQLRADLGWLGSALGPLRDLDVLVDYFRGEVEALGPDADGAPDLVSTLEARRADARAALLEAMGSERYLALLDDVEAFAADPPLEKGSDTKLSAIWWKETKRLRKAVDRLDSDPSDEDLHAVRILVKRARYAAELAANELGDLGAAFVERAKTAQDVLGMHQDASVGSELIESWAGDRPELQDAATRLLQREARWKLEARADWPEVWAKLDQAARRAHT
jgi:CHAD domain-containing protein